MSFSEFLKLKKKLMKFNDRRHKVFKKTWNDYRVSCAFHQILSKIKKVNRTKKLPNLENF